MTRTHKLTGGGGIQISVIETGRARVARSCSSTAFSNPWSSSSTRQQCIMHRFSYCLTRGSECSATIPLESMSGCTHFAKVYEH